MQKATSAVDDYVEPVTSILNYPIKVKHTPARLAHDILAHNGFSKFTSISVVGFPGSGKTTAVDCLVHAIHTKDPSYAIHHFKKEEILDLHRILGKLPKKQNCIMIFDDVSYLFEQLPEKKIAEILHDLTIIREKLDPSKATKSIVFMMFHYSFALLKSLRQSNFRIICSTGDEEKENLKKVFGYSATKSINDFFRRYLSMMRYGKFKIPSNTDEPFVYYTDKPFRLALVSNLGELHFTLYHDVKCGICKDRGKQQTYAPPNPSFWEDMFRTYDYNPCLNVLSKYLFFHTRRATVDSEFRTIWHHIEDLHKAENVNLLAIAKIFREAKKIKAAGARETDQRRKEFVITQLKEMEEKMLKDKDTLVSDSLTKVPDDQLNKGDETTINLIEDELSDEDDDDDLDDILEDRD